MTTWTVGLMFDADTIEDAENALGTWQVSPGTLFINLSGVVTSTIPQFEVGEGQSMQDGIDQARHELDQIEQGIEPQPVSPIPTDAPVDVTGATTPPDAPVTDPSVTPDPNAPTAPTSPDPSVTPPPAPDPNAPVPPDPNAPSPAPDTTTPSPDTPTDTSGGTA